MTAGIRIRAMAEGDLEKVEKIQRKCFSDPWSKEGLRESLGLSRTIWLVLEAEWGEDIALIGCAGMYTVLDEGEIVSVAVDPDARRKGYGRALVSRLLKEGACRGVRRAYLEVRVSNEAGKGLYRSLGFASCGIRKGFYEHPPEDAQVMYREVFPAISTGGQTEKECIIKS